MSEYHRNKKISDNAPQNYEQFFVPTIGAPVAKDLIRQASLQPGERVLDVACGTGIVSRLAYQKIVPDGSVSGLDVNPGMLAVAKFINKDLRINWYEACAEAMPFQDDSFDIVFCQMGLQFMVDKIIALQEMRRVLTPGGRLLLNVPGPETELFNAMSEALKQNISEQAAGFVSHVFSLYDPEEIKQLFNNAGFYHADIKTEEIKLNLPLPKDFLWQYIYSTPLATIVSEIDEKSLAAMEKEVVAQWQKFKINGSMQCAQPIVTINARK